MTRGPDEKGMIGHRIRSERALLKIIFTERLGGFSGFHDEADAFFALEIDFAFGEDGRRGEMAVEGWGAAATPAWGRFMGGRTTVVCIRLAGLCPRSATK